MADRGSSFPNIKPGDKVQTTYGGKGATVVGVVRQVTARQFTAKFPGQSGSRHPWFSKFRRSDGRSVGGKVFKWAKPAESPCTDCAGSGVACDFGVCPSCNGTGHDAAVNAFCDSHCCWSGHDKDCPRYDPPAGVPEAAMQRRVSVAQLQLLSAIVASPEGYSSEFGYPATFAALSRQGLIERTDNGGRYVATEAGRALIAGGVTGKGHQSFSREVLMDESSANDLSATSGGTR